MLKLKLENIIRENNGQWVMHVNLYDDAEPTKMLIRFTTKMDGIDHEAQTKAIARIKEKIDTWKEKENSKNNIKSIIQEKLDSLVL